MTPAALDDRRVAAFTPDIRRRTRRAFAPRSARSRWQRRADDRGGLLVLLSGGASAMLAAPVDGVDLDAKQETARLLMRAGAAIDELNCVRKHLSRIKGGRLAAAAGATITLALSDVHAPIADDPSVIGSGPTVADRDDLRRCGGDRREVPSRASSPRVRDHLAAGLRGAAEETVKPDDPRIRVSSYTVVGNRQTAVDGARRAALESRLRRHRRRRGHRRRSEPGRRGVRRDGAAHGSGAAASGLRAGIRRDDRHGSRPRLGRTEPGVRAGSAATLAALAGPQRRHRQRRNRWHRRPDRRCRGTGGCDDDRAGPRPWPESARGARAERRLPVSLRRSTT